VGFIPAANMELVLLQEPNARRAQMVQLGRKNQSLAPVATPQDWFNLPVVEQSHYDA